MASNTVVPRDAPLDGLFNYELHEEVGRGAVAIVHRATSKRGRFRNRQVAIKKIPRTSGVYPPSDFILSASLHSALYHPSIVSLISTFSAPSGYYQVLELHQEGTLANLLYARASHVLAEPELRGVTRTLLDVLIYLKKELVLHRDINLSNILVTQHGRIKLSGFDAAVKLPSADTTIDEFCGSANYVSPEILSGRPYSFAADLWSVGCVLVTCLSGVPAFNANNPDDVYNNICNVQYTLPISASTEVQDLISSILQKVHDGDNLLLAPPARIVPAPDPIVDSSAPTPADSTHKVSRGQLVVLPSRSLLVDFREGERRKGGKGREVMVISPDGGTIEVYDAPHLSTPCCLAEATAAYSLAHLPKSYVKQYNDAARLVDQLKARMPKLVHYAGEAKCTLMANGPSGDIEIVIPAEEDRKNTQQKAVRLRLHQKKCMLEISRYSGQPVGSKGRKDLGEWTKKVVALFPDLTLAVGDKAALDDLERLAMRHLSDFLRICDAANSPQDRDEVKP
ncbi:hypothetical protein VTO73DRAFT_6589 [Trametes versicolor]